MIDHIVILDFQVTKNEAEYERVISSLRLVKAFQAHVVVIFTYFKLVANQVDRQMLAKMSK